MQNGFDWYLLKLKENLDPMLDATAKNYRKVKNERMWLPLFVYYPIKQLFSLVTFGKRGMAFSKMQATLVPTIVGIPFLSQMFEKGNQFVTSHEWYEIFGIGFGVWYIFTLIYTFIQMPNWKNEHLFHIDAFRRFRPNEFAVVEPFLDKVFSIESINNWMLRNSNERTVTEMKKAHENTVDELTQALGDLEENLLNDIQRLEKEIEEYELNFKFLNSFTLNLSENVIKIDEGTLGYEHLYLINAPYCVFEVQNNVFRKLYQYIPRKTIYDSFHASDPRLQNEIFVKCFNSGELFFYENETEFAYRVNFEDGTSYIVAYYPDMGNEKVLSALLGYSIIGNTDQVGSVLETANLYKLIETQCRLIRKQLLKPVGGA